MSLNKRGNIWWIDFTDAVGNRIRRSTETENKALAQELHDKLKAETWRLQKLGENEKKYWGQAALMWMQQRKDKASLETDKIHLRWLDQHLKHLTVDQISKQVTEKLIECKLEEGVTNATVNRVMEVLRAILRAAVNEWEWVAKIPSIRMLPEPKRRIRWITHQEAQGLIKELPDHLSSMAVFSLATGLRRANVTGLRWDQVDMEKRVAWIFPDQAKARKAIGVPLNDDAMSEIIKQIGKHKDRVFSYRGKPIAQVSTKGWYAALLRSGIEDFRWHDLRHTWACWHVQNGTPLFALQEMGGWESAEMVRRYAFLSTDHLAPYAQKLKQFNDTPMSQQQIKEKDSRDCGPQVLELQH